MPQQTYQEEKNRFLAKVFLAAQNIEVMINNLDRPDEEDMPFYNEAIARGLTQFIIVLDEHGETGSWWMLRKEDACRAFIQLSEQGLFCSLADGEEHFLAP